MKALFIPVEGDIELIDIADDYEEINAKIGCHTMDVAGTEHLAFFVDDEGLIFRKPVNHRATDLYWVDGGWRGNFLVGDVLVGGPPDDEGEGTDFRITPGWMEDWADDLGLEIS